MNLAYSLLKRNNKVIYNKGLSNEKAFGLLLKLPSFEDREKLRSFLISKNIFPSILWPGQMEIRDIETEKTVMFLHMDYRYNTSDIKYITQTLNRYFTG